MEGGHGGRGPEPARVMLRKVFLGSVGAALLTIAAVVLFVLPGGGTPPVERLIPAGSSFARDIDFLIVLIGGLVGFWFLAALGTFFWLIWRFRARDGRKAEYLATHEAMLHRWVSWPHYLIILCDIFIIAAAVRVWVDVKQTLPPPDATVRIIAQQWAWTFIQPGPDGVLDTPDDITTVDELHVELGKLYHFELASRDVVHSFSVPVFRLKQDAVPGRVIKGWFKPTLAGRWDVQCAEMCGIGHALMPAALFVETPAQHQAFMAAHFRTASR